MIPATPASYLALAATAVGFAAGWTVNGWRWEARHAAAVQAQLDARAKVEQAAAAHSAALETRIAELTATRQTLERKLAHEIRKPDYRCRVPRDGVCLYNAAAGHAACQPDAAVPAPGTPR